MSVDPWADKYIWQSPYVFAHNSPVSLIDWKGLGDPPKRKSVEVKEGGSFWQIAQDDLGVNASPTQVLERAKEIAGMNNLTLNDVIHPGDKLYTENALNFDKRLEEYKKGVEVISGSGVTGEMNEYVDFNGKYLKGETEKNTFPAYYAKSDNLGPGKRLNQFRNGIGPTNLVFGPKMKWTKDLMKWSEVEKGRAYFYDKYQGASLPDNASVTSYRIKWNANDVISDGRNLYRHYVGSARLDIYTSDDNERLIFVLVSSSTRWSYKAHMPWIENRARTKEWPTSENPDPKQSTINQIWIWTEPVDEGKLTK